jgi:adenine phosphoribosyltransferase
MPIRSRIRTIPDYPKPGIQFRDITTLLQDAEGFRLAVGQIVDAWKGVRVDKVAGIEARGFILGGAVAYQLEAGFVPLRKQGKLPGETIGQDYELEYGRDRIEIHTDAISEGDRVLLLDDLIATGGTALAAIDVLEKVAARIVGCAAVIDLPDLGGSERIRARGLAVHSLCEFAGD